MKVIHVYPNVSAQYLIGGEWKKSSKSKEVNNPAKISEVVGEVALCSKEDVVQAIEAATVSFRKWSLVKPEERAACMRKAAQKLSTIIEEHVSLFVQENGKTIVEAKKDLLRCVEVMSQGADVLLDWWKAVPVQGAIQKVQIRRRPRGVTAVISPWNSPMILTFKRIVPAILAGNTVVIKPATSCPLTVISCLKIIETAFPPGVINIVTGSGAMIGEVLCKDERVRTIAFTGSTETGKEIMKHSSGTVKKLYMELGGNDPALILPDANLNELAMQRIQLGILRAAGQVCSAIKRVYVHESRYEELFNKLEKQFSGIVVGNGIHPDTTMGPLNNKTQFELVEGLLTRAKQAGVTITTLGQKLNSETWEEGYFMLPSIVTNISHNSELVRAEQFGPVIPIVPYSDIEEAIEMANDTEFGLRASVWTSDESNAINIADSVEAGAVFYNNHTIFQNLRLDFPGIKESGLSRETQWGGLELFTDSYGFAN